MITKKRYFKRPLFLLISVVVFVLSKIVSALKPGRNKYCTILYYHAIADEHLPGFVRQMDALLRWTQPIPIDFSAPLGPHVHYSAVTFDDAFESVKVNALPALKARNIPFSVFVIANALGQTLGWDGYPERTMTIEELRHLPSDLVLLGSHTLTHPNLLMLDEREARRELLESRMVLSRLLQRDIRLFSFPYGAFNQTLVELCRDAGYEKVFTTLPYPASGEPGEFVVGRVVAEPTDWLIEFYLKVMGGYRWMAPAIQWKHQLISSVRRRWQPDGVRAAG